MLKTTPVVTSVTLFLFLYLWQVSCGQIFSPIMDNCSVACDINVNYHKVFAEIILGQSTLNL